MMVAKHSFVASSAEELRVDAGLDKHFFVCYNNVRKREKDKLQAW